MANLHNFNFLCINSHFLLWIIELMNVVLPGDRISLPSKWETEGSGLSANTSNVVRVGEGVKVNGNNLVANVSGILRYKKPAHVWVDTSRRKYLPNSGDYVVGLVEERGGDFYLLNIFSGTNCILNRLAFDGATKRNKPELKRGDIVYARVMNVGGLGADLEVTCTSSNATVRKEWSSGETIFGALSPGILIHTTSLLSQRLLRPDCAVLLALSKHFAFEIAIGMNHVIWLRTTGPNEGLMIIRNAILESEEMDDIQIVALVDQLARRLKR
jgi:exosome complex component RRP40